MGLWPRLCVPLEVRSIPKATDPGRARVGLFFLPDEGGAVDRAWVKTFLHAVPLAKAIASAVPTGRGGARACCGAEKVIRLWMSCRPRLRWVLSSRIAV